MRRGLHPTGAIFLEATSIHQQETVDLAKVQSFFHDYENFEGDVQAIDIATSRVSRCPLRSTLEDRAIELGIALEAVLMFSPLGEDRSGINQEISFKIGTRAVWLLGINREDRKVIFSQARRLYELRSRSTHGTRFKEKDCDKIAHDLDNGAMLVRRIVGAILARRKWIDWIDLTLGSTSRRWAKRAIPSVGTRPSKSHDLSSSGQRHRSIGSRVRHNVPSPRVSASPVPHR